MSDMFCEYKGLRYKVKKRNGEFLITSRIKRDDFINYIDVLGNEHKDYYMKTVNLDEIDLLYNQDMYIKYKDVFFQLFSNKISRSAVLDNSFMIWTNSEEMAYKYEFEKKEQFVFIKYITRDEIQAIKVVRIPVLTFKEIGTSEVLLQGNDVTDFLEALD